MTRELWYFGAHVVKGDYYLWGKKKHPSNSVAVSYGKLKFGFYYQGLA